MKIGKTDDQEFGSNKGMNDSNNHLVIKQVLFRYQLLLNFVLHKIFKSKLLFQIKKNPEISGNRMNSGKEDYHMKFEK